MGLFDSGGKKGWSADRAWRRSIAKSDELIAALPAIFAPVAAAEAEQKLLLSQGFDSARSEMNLAGRGAEQFISDSLNRESGMLQQNLISSNLTGSTVARNAFRGVGSNADRRMAELQSALAPMFAQNQQQKGRALAAVTGQAAKAQSRVEVESVFALQKGAMALGAGAGKGGGGGLLSNLFSDIGKWIGGDWSSGGLDGGGGVAEGAPGTI